MIGSRRRMVWMPVRWTRAVESEQVLGRVVGAQWPVHPAAAGLLLLDAVATIDGVQHLVCIAEHRADGARRHCKLRFPVWASSRSRWKGIEM